MSFTTVDTEPVYFGIGRRKTSVAKVTLVPGNGSLVVNHKPGTLYLNYNSLCIKMNEAKAILFFYLIVAVIFYLYPKYSLYKIITSIF